MLSDAPAFLFSERFYLEIWIGVKIHVEVIVEKRSYARDGVHLGMQGWICLEQRTEGYWLVNFPQCGDKEDIAEISIKEEDLKVIAVMNAAVNERIKAQFDAETSSAKYFDVTDDNLSGHMV